MGLYRALDHFQELPDGRFKGISGDTFAMIVEFSDTPHGQGVIVPGNATQPKSKHDDDQMQLFVDRRLRPVWRDRSDVEAHAEAREVLHR